MKYIKRENGKTWTIWSICHLVSLIIKHGLLNTPDVKNYIAQAKALYNYFNHTISDQIFDGICEFDDFENVKIQNVIDKAFNNLYKPLSVIFNNYEHILKTLKFIKDNKPDEDVKKLWTFFSKFENLYLTTVILSFTAKCHRLVCYLSTKLMDIITVQASVARFKREVTIYAANTFSINCPYVKELRKQSKFYTAQGVEKCRYKSFTWNVKRQDAVRYCNKVGSDLNKSVLTQLNEYIKESDAKFWAYLAHLIDPAKLSIYSDLSEAAAHGIAELDSITHIMNNKRDDFGLRVGYNFDHTMVQSEYEYVKRILWQNRNYEPHRMHLRIRKVMSEIISDKELYPQLSALLLPINTLWPTQVDVERDFNIRQWILVKQRQNMLSDMFDAIMRIICNAPNEKDDGDEYKKWIIQSVVEWHNLKERNHDIVLLKKLSNLMGVASDTNPVQLLDEAKSNR